MKMKWNKLIALLLALLQVISFVPLTASAAQISYGHQITVDPTYTAIGAEATVTVSLKDYTQKKSGIRGFQIDIQNTDGLLENARCTSLVEDPEADVLTNTAAYQPERNVLRQVYARETGTLPLDQLELLEVKIPIPESSENMGSYTLPMRLLIQNEAGQKLTYEEEIEIKYASEEMLNNAVMIEADKTELVQGETAKLTAQILPQNMTGTKIGWELEESAKAIATLKINKDGSATVTAKAVTEKQTFTVTAYTEDNSAQPCSKSLSILPKEEMVKIHQDSRDGEEVTGQTLRFDLNGPKDENGALTMQLAAVVLPEDARQSVIWKSSNTKIADIDAATGLVTFKNVAGTVKFTATTVGSKKSASVSVQTIFVPTNLKKVNQGKEGEPDIILIGGKSHNLKVRDLDAKKDLTTKQIVWSLDEQYAPFASVTAAGKLTTKKVLAHTSIEVVGALVGSKDSVIVYYVDIYPAVNYVELQQITQSEEAEDQQERTTVTGKVIPFDFADRELKLEALLHPGDALGEDVSWYISDSQNAYAERYTIDGNTLTVSGAKNKKGTVTIKATANDGSKKSATVKLQFASYAKSLVIEGPEQLAGGGSAQLAATMTPTKPTKDGFTWSLKDPADKSYVTLTSAGKLTAKPIYIQREVTIVAASKDGMARAEKTITLIPGEAKLLILKCDGENVTKSTVYVDSNTESSVVLSARTYGEESEADIKEWRSSNKNLATVDSGGVVTLKEGKTGSTTITAFAADGRQATVTLKVAKLASDLEINEPDEGLEVASGKSLKLTAALPDAASGKVTWSIVKGSEYAKISSSGAVTAVKDLTRAHTVTVRAVAADGSGEEDTADITIRPLAQGVQVYSQVQNFRVDSNERIFSNTTLNLDVTDGLELDFDAHVYPYYGENDECAAIQKVTWKSSNPKIATVDENGHVSTVYDEKKDTYKTGSVTITATAADGSNKKVTFKLNLQKWIRDFELEDQVLAGGKSLNLAKLLKLDPTDVTNKKLTWKITGGDGAAYATLSSSGSLKVKALTAPKTVEVTVTAQDDGQHSETVTVRLYPATTKVTISSGGANVTGQKITITTQEMLFLSGVSEPANAANVYTWKSSNPKIAVVDKDGNVQAAEGGKTGTVTITCTAADGSNKKATMQVTITNP